MVVNPKTLLQYALRKQNKISHVPCETLVFAKDEIPEDILNKIENQYSSDFLDDADFVSFTKGPIDKDMIKKLFKATDKALGEEANKLTEGDFKLLKMKDTDDGLEGLEDPGDETPDSEIDAIVGGEDAETEESAEDETDAANEQAIGDALDDGTDSDDGSEGVKESIENNSIYARMHQGKSMAQWEKEFKGEFDVNQLWRMATSGCDLQKLLLQLNGNITIEDSDMQMNEAKEEKEDADEDDENETADDSSSDDSSEKEDIGDDESEEDSEDKGSNPSGIAAEKSDVPTKWVFLKITIKK